MKCLNFQIPAIEKYLKRYPAAVEYGFLLDCCRAAFAGTSVRYTGNICPDVFGEILQHHRLVPHLYPILKNHCENLPETILRRVQQLLKHHNLHILKLTGELVRLGKLFTANDIPWLSVKGPALSMQLYENIAARQSGDLDILVQFKDVGKAVFVISEAGYESNIDWPVDYMMKYYKDLPFRHVDSNVLVELHWLLDFDHKALINRNHFDTDVDFVLIEDYRIPTFSIDFNWLYLCSHGYHHAWHRIFWLWDYAVIIKKLSSRQAENLIEQIQKNKLTSALGQAIGLIKEIFSIQLPEPFNQIPIPKRVIALTYRFMFTKDMMNLRNHPFRLYYKLKTFSVGFFFSYYFRWGTITRILRKCRKAAMAIARRCAK